MVTLPEVYFSLVRGEQSDLGGQLRLRASKRQVVLANRALQFNLPDGALLPTTLEQEKGQVPLFYSERVSFQSENGETSFPFFLVKDDLDRAYDELTKEATRRSTESTEESGIPIGLVRVATLDGLIDQMSSGSLDLSQAVIVGSRDALVTVKQLVQDGSAKAGGA